jgi:hypothetical protein
MPYARKYCSDTKKINLCIIPCARIYHEFPFSYCFVPNNCICLIFLFVILCTLQLWLCTLWGRQSNKLSHYTLLLLLLLLLLLINVFYLRKNLQFKKLKNKRKIWHGYHIISVNKSMSFNELTYLQNSKSK